MAKTGSDCVYCEEATRPLTNDEEFLSLSGAPGWELLRDGTHTLSKKFVFPTYMGMIAFVDKIALAAEAEGHHPDLYLFYKELRVNLTTHTLHGLSQKDFAMAAKIDALFGK